MTSPFTHPKIAYIKENKKGHDYVVGDIHGRYDLVEKALKLANFNEHKDRLFCVGDLINRGSLSEQVLEFLARPYVYAIRGNHEEMLLDLYNVEGELSEEMLRYYADGIGMDWWFFVSDDNRLAILEALRKLPLVMEVKTNKGLVGMVHADIPLDLTWDEFKFKVEQEDYTTIQNALWERHRLNEMIEKEVSGVWRIFIGHTPQPAITRLANVIGIDTGAVYGDYLTMARLTCENASIDFISHPRDDVQIIQ
jgi:serine/threonine protein phosphatase 1